MAKDRDEPRPPVARLAGTMEMETLTDEQIVTRGRRRVLELYFDALEQLEEIMVHGGPGDAPRVSAIAQLSHAVDKGPFAMVKAEIADDLELARRVSDAMEQLRTGAGLTVAPEPEEQPGDASTGTPGTDMAHCSEVSA